MARPLTVSGVLPATPPPKPRSDTVEEAAAAFGKIASVLMRNAETGQYRLTDLGWLVAPAVSAGTYAIVDATNADTRATTPAAVALWAYVSAAVDYRLSDNLSDPVCLLPEEWQSGSIPWLVIAAGEPQAMQRLLAHLLETRFVGQAIKMRTVDAEGRAALGLLTKAV